MHLAGIPVNSIHCLWLAPVTKVWIKCTTSHLQFHLDGQINPMATMHQNGHRAQRKGGSADHVIANWEPLFQSRMPSHANCVVPGCLNRKDKCKWGLFSSEEDVQECEVYVKRRLCGSMFDKVGCDNASHSCKSVSYHRLLKDAGAHTVLRKKWLTRIPRENTPLMPNSLWYSFSSWSPRWRKRQSCNLPW